jgi:autotransporter-associated beta strand protein
VVTAATKLTLSGQIDDGLGIGNMSKTGDGTLVLSATNGYTGVTTVSLGTLALDTSGQIASSSSIANAATFSVLDGSHIVKAITGVGTTNVYGTATLTAPSIVQGTLTIGGVAPAAGAVPEPSTMVLLALAGLALAGAYLRRK